MSSLDSEFNYFQTALESNDGIVLADCKSKLLWSDGGIEIEVALILMANTLIIYKAGGNAGYKRALNLNSVVGVHEVATKSSNKATSMKLYQYELPPNKGCLSRGQSRERRRCEHTFVFPDSEQCALWCNKMNSLLGNPNSNGFVKKYLVFVNPVSGTGQGKTIYEKTVKGMLKEARIESVPILTERQNHAFDIVKDKKFDLDQYAAIVIIGGDGLLYEVVNGIAERGLAGMEILKTIPLAPIPGGTGNGLAKSVLFECDDECYSAKSATFLAIKGSSSPFDLSEVATTTETKYAFLSMSWGLISDLDIRSEWMRCIGEIRLHLAAFYFMLRRKQYQGRLLLRLAKAEEADSSDGSINKNKNKNNEGSLDEIHPLFGNDFVAETPKHLLKIISGSFQLIWVVQTPFASGSTYSGPGVELNDGLLTVFVVQGLSRCELLQLLLDVDSGAHINRTGVQTYKCHAYRIEPFLDTEDDTSEKEDRGIFALDGECIDGPMIGPVQGKVLPGGARIMKIMKL